MTDKYKYNWTVGDVAKEYGYNVHYIRNMARCGLIPARKRGRQWQFSKEELAIFFEMQLERARNVVLPSSLSEKIKGGEHDGKREFEGDSSS